VRFVKSSERYSLFHAGRQALVPLDDVESMVNGNVTNSNGVCGAASSQRIRLTKMLSESNNPDEKRKIIRDIFVKVANEAVTEMYLKPR